MRVLAVKDHSQFAEAVAGGLNEERMAVDVAYDGQDALCHVAMIRYHVIVLDQELPACTATRSARTWPAAGADANRAP